ncbi:MAG TPA: alpha/beta hydrolase [Anaerolineales bacterium]
MPTSAGLYYFAHGASDATRPPIILIHGAGGHHLSWPPQVRRLPGERIFAVDLPGHGKSGGVGRHTIEDYAAAILDFVAALKLSTVVLVGHSMGGAIALRAAIEAPDQMMGLGLLGSAARLRVSSRLLHAAADPAKAAEAVHTVIEYSFAPGTSPRLKELVEQRMLETRPSVLYGDLLACDAFEEDAKISIPTLILFGELDRMVSPQAGKALQGQIAGARFETIPEAGHMVMLEQPELVAERMSAFVKSIPYQPGK